eukprot:12733-Heterococcus_DN1.PRE.10
MAATVADAAVADTTFIGGSGVGTGTAERRPQRHGSSGLVLALTLVRTPIQQPPTSRSNIAKIVDSRSVKSEYYAAHCASRAAPHRANMLREASLVGMCNQFSLLSVVFCLCSTSAAAASKMSPLWRCQLTSTLLCTAAAVAISSSRAASQQSMQQSSSTCMHIYNYSYVTHKTASTGHQHSPSSVKRQLIAKSAVETHRAAESSSNG